MARGGDFYRDICYFLIGQKDFNQSKEFLWHFARKDALSGIPVMTIYCTHACCCILATSNIDIKHEFIPSILVGDAFSRSSNIGRSKQTMCLI